MYLIKKKKNYDFEHFLMTLQNKKIFYLSSDCVFFSFAVFSKLRHFDIICARFNALSCGPEWKIFKEPVRSWLI